MNIKKIKIITYLLFVFTSAMFLSSCSTSLKKGFNNLFSEDRQQEEQYSKQDTYLLGPDDVLKITVEQHPEWSGEYTVGPKGNITIPDIGEIYAGELLKEDLEAALVTRIGKYIKNPRIKVDIVRYASQVIYIMGEVARPGRYPTEGKNITLRDAIITAGLPRRYAATGRVFVITSSRSGKPIQKVINLNRILYRGELERNIMLNPGDIVYVPKTVLGMLTDFLSVLTGPFSSISAVRAATVP